MADPLLVLAPPRCFTSLVCAMLGQHPQMCGVAELNLCLTDTVGEWWTAFRRGRGLLAHGLVRTVGELFFGGQTDETARLARLWIWNRRHLTTAEMFHLIVDRAHPRILVEKSPSNVSTSRTLGRMRDAFPNARYLHLVRHPAAQGESLLNVGVETGFPPSALERWLADYGPQRWWFTCHANIAAFLEPMPPSRKIRVRGEDLLERPEAHLTAIAGWLGLRTDADAIDSMKHPERSPFARPGPRAAQWGNDPHFQDRPYLQPRPPKPLSLETPLRWNGSQAGFPPELKQLARAFGYA